MRPLKLKFRRKGYDYAQVERGKSWAIYSQGRGGKIVAFEAILIRTRPEREIAGETIPAREICPCDADWGRDAWTFSTFGGQRPQADTLNLARIRIAEVQAAQAARKERA